MSNIFFCIDTPHSERRSLHEEKNVCIFKMRITKFLFATVALYHSTVNGSEEGLRLDNFFSAAFVPTCEMTRTNDDFFNAATNVSTHCLQLTSTQEDAASCVESQSMFLKHFIVGNLPSYIGAVERDNLTSCGDGVATKYAAVGTMQVLIDVAFNCESTWTDDQRVELLRFFENARSRATLELLCTSFISTHMFQTSFVEGISQVMRSMTSWMFAS